MSCFGLYHRVCVGHIGIPSEVRFDGCTIVEEPYSNHDRVGLNIEHDGIVASGNRRYVGFDNLSNGDIVGLADAVELVGTNRGLRNLRTDASFNVSDDIGVILGTVSELRQEGAQVVDAVNKVGVALV